MKMKKLGVFEANFFAVNGDKHKIKFFEETIIASSHTEAKKILKDVIKMANLKINKAVTGHGKIDWIVIQKPKSVITK